MELTFSFTEEEAQIILNALLKEPCGKVLFVVNKLQDQAVFQMNKKKENTYQSDKNKKSDK